MILITFIIKDGDEFYPQLFLEHCMMNKHKHKALKQDASKELMSVVWYP